MLINAPVRHSLIDVQSGIGYPRNLFSFSERIIAIIVRISSQFFFI
jgi:hypothetical protein